MQKIKSPAVAGQPGPTSLSSVALVAANCIPLLGVLLADWRIGDIMLLFWAESAVVGFFNLLKMWWIGRWSVLLMGPLFVGHYGAFMAGHLLFIYGFFRNGFGSTDGSVGQVAHDFLQLWPALLAIFISHGISFRWNFLGRREYLGRKASDQMNEPYKRIVIMHLTIILGGFFALALNSALPALLLLILFKILVDMRAHLKEHGGTIRSTPSPA